MYCFKESGSEVLEYDDVIHNTTHAPREGCYGGFDMDGRKRLKWKRIFLENGKNSPLLKISGYVWTRQPKKGSIKK